jgi:hypothetical protein
VRPYQFALKKFLSPCLLIKIGLADFIDNSPEPGFGIGNDFLNLHMEIVIDSSRKVKWIKTVDCIAHVETIRITNGIGSKILQRGFVSLIK